ncbi:MAG: hypothetical protein EA406_06700 [Rhodospirillales bacterium]|nr:MAG: hypothetical protein EA406_06700 [Rhodospirillales bacterium]
MKLIRFPAETVATARATEAEDTFEGRIGSVPNKRIMMNWDARIARIAPYAAIAAAFALTFLVFAAYFQ